MTVSEHHASLLTARGFDMEIVERYGIESYSLRGRDGIRFPYLFHGSTVNHKWRTLDPPKAFSQDAGARKVFWNADAIFDTSLASQPLIITEGELDALAAIQAGFPRTVSVPDGAPAVAKGEDDGGTKYDYVTDMLPSLKPVKQIILATDGDTPGVNLMNDLAIRLGKARCKFVRYPKGCKDLADALVRFGSRGVVETLNRAKWWLIDGLATMSRLPPYTEPTPFEIGIPDFSLYRVRLGDLCVISGISSMGKTQWTIEVCSRLVSQYGWRIACASFENVPQTDLKRALRRWHGQKAPYLQTREELAKADQWIEDHFLFIAPAEDQDVTLAWLLEHMAAAVVRYDAKVIVIDPWNELSLERPRDMTQSEYVGACLMQLRRFARKHQVHVIVVAHPSKLQRNKEGQYPIPSLFDVEESRHWYGRPDIGIIIHQESGETLVRLAKSKFHDSIGKPGDAKLIFNPEQGRYICPPRGAYFND